MIRLLATAAVTLAALVASASVDAAPAKKKYHYELTQVTAKADVPADVAAIAQPRVKAQVEKAFSTHEQLVADMTGAPDAAANPTGYRKFLVKKGLADSFYVTVDITAASTDVEPMDSKPGTQRLTVHVAVHMLGEHIPGRTIAFTGEGEATIKQEVGKTVRQADRDYAWDGAAESAVNEALEKSLSQLAKPQPKP